MRPGLLALWMQTFTHPAAHIVGHNAFCLWTNYYICNLLPVTCHLSPLTVTVTCKYYLELYFLVFLADNLNLLSNYDKVESWAATLSNNQWQQRPSGENQRAEILHEQISMLKASNDLTVGITIWFILKRK